MKRILIYGFILMITCVIVAALFIDPPKKLRLSDCIDAIPAKLDKAGAYEQEHRDVLRKAYVDYCVNAYQ